MTFARSWSMSASSPPRSHLLRIERGRAPGLHRQVGDAQVLRGDAVLRVADDEGDVGALGRPLRAQRRVVLDRLAHLGLAAHARGVDDDQPAVADLDREVDRVARGARDVGDDHPLLPGDLVDEARLADVRAADDREADDVLLLGRLVVLGQHARPSRRAGRRCRGPARRRPRRARRGRGAWNSWASGDVADAVDLVRGHDDRLVPAAQQVGELLVAGPAPRARVDDEHRDVGVVERGLGLLADRAGERVDVGVVDAAGVDEREAAPVPLRGDLVAVAGDPRALVHDGLARAAQAVDERGLADVRIADDRDLPHRARASPTIRSTTSSIDRPVVSSSSAPSATASGEASRELSRSSRACCWAQDLLEVGAELRGAALGALARVGGQEDLHLGVGGDDRADVAALGDPVALGHQLALALDHAPRGRCARRRRATPPRRPRACGSGR